MQRKIPGVKAQIRRPHGGQMLGIGATLSQVARPASEAAPGVEAVSWNWKTGGQELLYADDG